MNSFSTVLRRMSVERQQYALKAWLAHLVDARMWEKLEHVLCDLTYAEAKCEAGLLFDLTSDFDSALGAHQSSAIAQIRKAFLGALSHIAERPELTMQMLYNRLYWYRVSEPRIRGSLRIVFSELMRRGCWIRAEAPLPEATTERTLSVAFEVPSFIQSLSPQKDTVAVVSRQGRLEQRHLPYGKLLATRELGVGQITALALCDDQRVVFSVADGMVYLEGTTDTFAGRRGEKLLAYAPDLGVVAVREDDALVCWQPERNQITVLAPSIPAPLVVLEVDPEGQRLFFVAGDRKQVLGVCSLNETVWTTTLVPFDGPLVLDAKIDWEAQHLLLATQNRQLQIVETPTGNVHAQIAYETLKDVSVRGIPSKCALGQGNSDGWAYLATQIGHLGAWNWRQHTFERLEDYATVSAPARLCYFEVLSQTGRLLLTFQDHALLITPEDQHRQGQQHTAAVTGCILTESRAIVSISDQERTIRWHSQVGLKQQTVDAIRYRPTALALTYESDTVLVGTKRGQVWKQQPGVAVPLGKVDQIFSEPVVSMFGMPDGSAMVASRSGRVVRNYFASDRADVLIKAREGQRLRKIMPAGRYGLYWCSYVDLIEGLSVLTLVATPGQETIMWQSTRGLSDVAVSSDGSLLCLAGRELEVWQPSEGTWVCKHHRPEPVQQVAFLENGKLLAVVLRNEPWLEIWRVADGLPKLAAHELPRPATLLSCRGDAVVVGFRSGELMSLRYCRGET